MDFKIILPPHALGDTCTKARFTYNGEISELPKSMRARRKMSDNSLSRRQPSFCVAVHLLTIDSRCTVFRPVMKKAKAHLVIVTMISRPQQFIVHLKLYEKTTELINSTYLLSCCFLSKTL